MQMSTSPTYVSKRSDGVGLRVQDRLGDILVEVGEVARAGVGKAWVQRLLLGG